MTDSIFAAGQDAEFKFELCRKASFSKMVGQRAPRSAGVALEGEDPTLTAKKEKMWKLMELYLPVSAYAIQRGIVNHVVSTSCNLQFAHTLHQEYTLARTRFNFDEEDCYRATAYSVRDRLIETLNDTVQYFFAEDCKRCYYLSLEFLLGRGTPDNSR